MGESVTSLFHSLATELPLHVAGAGRRKSLDILHVSPTHYAADSVIGGGEKYVVYMCRAIDKAAPGKEVDVRNKVIAFSDQNRVYNINPQLQCELLPGRPWDPYSISPEMLGPRLKAADLVVVHQCLSAFGMFVAAHAAMLNKPVIGLDHGGGEHPLVHLTPTMGKLFQLFHAYSRFGSASFQGLNGKVNIAAGPVDTEFYSYQPGFPRDPKTVLSVGRLLPHKGFDRIIRSLPVDLKLVIIGSGYDTEYREYLRQLSVGKQVAILEGLSDDEVLTHMRSAGLYVHASTHRDYRGTFYAKPELLGLAPLEAMSTGAPALVSNAGSLPELANVAGCEVFRDDAHLAEILTVYAAGLFDLPPGSFISADVKRLYGLEAFGDAFLRGALSILR